MEVQVEGKAECERGVSERTIQEWSKDARAHKTAQQERLLPVAEESKQQPAAPTKPPETGRTDEKFLLWYNNRTATMAASRQTETRALNMNGYWVNGDLAAWDRSLCPPDLAGIACHTFPPDQNPQK